MTDGEDLSAALGRMRIVTRVAPGPAHSIPIPCRFFLEGHCANGDSCRFEHPEDERDNQHQSQYGYRSVSNAFSNHNHNTPGYAHPSLALSPASSNNPFASSGSLPTIPIPVSTPLVPTNARNVSGFAPPRPEDYNGNGNNNFGGIANCNGNGYSTMARNANANANGVSRFAPNTFVGFSAAYSSVFEASDDEDDADELLRAATTPRSSMSMLTSTVGAAHSSTYAAAVTANTPNDNDNNIAIPTIPSGMWSMHPTNLASSPQHRHHSHGHHSHSHSHSSSFVGSPISMLHANGNGNRIHQSRSHTSLPPTPNGHSHVNCNGHSHVNSAPQSSPPPSSRPTVTGSSGVLCRFHLVGDCRYGERCRYVHGYACPECGENAVHPTDEMEALAHITQCRQAQERKKRMKQSENTECGICYEKPVLAKRKFGLLQNCDHAFCLPCIREWRGAESACNFGREAVRVCPLCRTESFLVIPSDTYESDAEIRRELLEKYKRKLNSIPCKHFDYGRGDCPFGGSCMYAHTDTEGIRIEENTDTNILVSDAGVRVKTHKATLADYLPPPR